MSEFCAMQAHTTCARHAWTHTPFPISHDTVQLANAQLQHGVYAIKVSLPHKGNYSETLRLGLAQR